MWTLAELKFFRSNSHSSIAEGRFVITISALRLYTRFKEEDWSTSSMEILVPAQWQDAPEAVHIIHARYQDSLI